MRTSRRRCCSAVIVTALAPHASADFIHPGETIPLYGTTLALRPDLDGPVVAEAIVPFGNPLGPYFGHVEVRLLEHTGAPLGFPRQQQFRIVDFYDGGRGYAIDFLRGESQGFYFSTEEDVNFMRDGEGTFSPATASWADSPAPIVFNFSSPIPAGSDSVRMYYLAPAGFSDGLGNWGAAVGVRSPNGGVEAAGFMSYGLYVPHPAAWAVLVTGWLMSRTRRRRLRPRRRGGVSPAGMPAACPA